MLKDRPPLPLVKQKNVPTKVALLAEKFRARSLKEVLQERAQEYLSIHEALCLFNAGTQCKKLERLLFKLLDSFSNITAKDLDYLRQECCKARVEARTLMLKEKYRKEKKKQQARAQRLKDLMSKKGIRTQPQYEKWLRKIRKILEKSILKGPFWPEKIKVISCKQIGNSFSVSGIGQSTKRDYSEKIVSANDLPKIKIEL